MGGIDEHRLDLRFDGDALAMVLATPSRERARGVVVMLHGGPGGQKDGPDGLYSGLAGALGTEGIASLRFDFRGVGESGGRYRDMTIERQTAEYEAVCSLARAWGFARLGVVGESYGATIALRSAQAKLDVVCLLWPAVYFLDGTFSPFVVPEKLATARRDGFTVEEGQEIGLPFLEEALEMQDVEPGVRRLKVPTLLIHGTSDREVPIGQSQRAFDLLDEPKRLVAVPGGEHCLSRPHEREIVNREVVRWFDEYL